MSTYIRTSSKSGVTGVTRVTTYAKRPNSLAFKSVTRMRGAPYSRCNSAKKCNAKTRLRPAAGRCLPRADKGLSLVTLAKYRAWDQSGDDARATDQ
jgi:hypothetical protein